jgi:phage terminase large subunit
MATNPNLERIEKAQFAYFALAKRLGVSADQLRNFRNGGYVAQEKQLMFHAACRECDLPGGPTQVGFGGARGPGKSHGIFAQVALDDCQRFADLKVLYLRKVAKNAKEQFEDLRRSVLKNIKHDHRKISGTIFFDNGSRILIGHFKNESDIDNYLGLEYDIIAIEEGTTLTLSKYKTLRDSNRTSKEGFRPRIYVSTNPGSIGHAWFKERFIKPARENRETDTRFIFATVDDNAFIDDDYTKKLEDNTGWKLKAYRYGDWDIAAGQFFTTFRYDVHAKDGLKAIPGASFWASLDYGFTHYTVSHLFMRYDGHTSVLDEFAERKQLVSQNADGIKSMLKRHGLTPDNLSNFVAGHDCFASRGVSTGETVADEYQRAGIRLTRADIDRISGAARILQMLGDVDRKENPIEPTISISTRCARLLECLPVLEHDPKRPEDVLKVDADDEGNGGDDAYDSARYGLMASTGGGIWL